MLGFILKDFIYKVHCLDIVMKKLLFFIVLVVLFFSACTTQDNISKQIINSNQTSNVVTNDPEIKVATFAGGCFWCTEAQYLSLEGVSKVTSGYAGGATKNPTYKEICTGTTGHAEVIKIEYDADVISFEEILQAFFVAHDPTQLNRQGADVGTQYRSTIMPINDEQKKIAEAIIKEFNDKEVFSHAVVTTVEPLDVFYAAEDYHQNYYENNAGANPYCTRVVGPKLEKFKKDICDKSIVDEDVRKIVDAFPKTAHPMGAPFSFAPFGALLRNSFRIHEMPDHNACRQCIGLIQRQCLHRPVPEQETPGDLQ